MPKKSSTIHPLYIANEQAGYNPKSKRWHGVDGKYINKNEAMLQNQLQETGDSGLGGIVKYSIPTPISTAYGRVEALMFGSPVSDDMPFAGLANWLQAQLSPSPFAEKRPVDWMPSRISTRMRLAEHYFNTEGDAEEICSVPVELISGDIVVDAPSTELRQDIETLLFNVDMAAVISELWLSQRTFGQAYPYEVWNGNSLEGVIPLPPLYVHRGNMYNFSLSSEMFGVASWTQTLVESRFPPIAYRELIDNWNDAKVGMGIEMPLPLDNVTAIRDKGFSWYNYTMPMLSRAFRDFTSRIVHEDAVRAVTEGYKYQLWVVKVGDKDHIPLPNEIRTLKAELGKLSGERTGTFVWKNPFEIEVHIPKGLDDLIGSDYHGQLTRSIFRKMGITPRVISGETPGILGAMTSGGASGDVAQLDVQLYMQRVKYQARQKILPWLHYIVGKWIRKTSRVGLREMKNVRFGFVPTDIEMAERVKNIFSPMYESGALSWDTYLKSVGLLRENEENNKREEKPLRDEGLLDPPISFKQEVVNPDGSSKDTSSAKSKGSPDTTGEVRNRMAKGLKDEEPQDNEGDV